MKRALCFLIATLPLNALAYDRTPEGGIATINLCLSNGLMTKTKWRELHENIVLQDFYGKSSLVNKKSVDDKTNIMLQMFGLRDLRGLCSIVYNDYNLSSNQKDDIIIKRREVENGIKNLKGSAKGGNSESQYKIALGYIESDDIDNAVHWFYKAARQGHPDAQYRLADILSIGKRGYPADEKKAIYWYKEAYKGGLEFLEYDIAHAYYHMKPKSKDNLIEALAWYLVVQEKSKGNKVGGAYKVTRENIMKINNKLSAGEREVAKEKTRLYVRYVL